MFVNFNYSWNSNIQVLKTCGHIICSMEFVGAEHQRTFLLSIIPTTELALLVVDCQLITCCLSVCIIMFFLPFNKYGTTG